MLLRSYAPTPLRSHALLTLSAAALPAGALAWNLRALLPSLGQPDRYRLLAALHLAALATFTAFQSSAFPTTHCAFDALARCLAVPCHCRVSVVVIVIGPCASACVPLCAPTPSGSRPSVCGPRSVQSATAPSARRCDAARVSAPDARRVPVSRTAGWTAAACCWLSFARIFLSRES